MRRSLFSHVGMFVFACAVILLMGQVVARAQEPKPKTWKIEFKVFPANNPTGDALDPLKVATIHYRNKVEELPDLKFDLPVFGPDERKFYWVEVQEGWLIDNLVIRVKGAVNPAIVTKLVSKNNMVLYPGASDSTDAFKFPAYMTQMGTYRSLFREFVEDAPLGVREKRRSDLLAAFRQQLENMAKVGERLPKVSEEDIATATKLKDEVIKLYFGLPDPPQVYYCPVRRCGLFGRLRGR